MTETGVIHGRFQILHLKHMEYILAAKMRCKKLYIGITNPGIRCIPRTLLAISIVLRNRRIH